MMSYPKPSKGARENLKDQLKEIATKFPTLELKRTIGLYAGDKTVSALPSAFVVGDYLCSENAVDALLALVHVLREQKFEDIKLSEKAFKVTAVTEIENQKVGITARLFKNDDITTYITFERTEGTSMKFHDAVKIVEEGLNKVTTSA